MRTLISFDLEVSDQQAHEELGTVEPHEVARELTVIAERRIGPGIFGFEADNASIGVVPLLEDEEVHHSVPEIGPKASLVVIDGKTWRRGPDNLWYEVQ